MASKQQGSVARAVRVIGAAGLMLFLAGCGGTSAKSGAVSPPSSSSSSSSSSSAASGASAATPTAAAAKATKAEVNLKASGGASTTGTATLEQTAEKVTYKVTVSGASEGAHALYIVGSNCEASGNRTGPLNPLNASADGQGSAEGTMLLQLSTLVGRSIAVYASDKGDSSIVACGPITGQ